MELLGDGLRCSRSGLLVSRLDSLDRAEQALGDWLLAEVRGQTDAHWTCVHAMTDHAAAHTGLGLDDGLPKPQNPNEMKNF